MANRYFIFISIIIITLTFIGGISVVGFLQSTVRIGSSGIVVIPAPPSRPSTQQPVTTIDISIYNDIECADEITNIEWGSIEAGSSVSKIIYIKNSGNDGVVLSLNTNNWIPPEAVDHMDLTWDYDGDLIHFDDVLEIELTLTINTSIVGTDNFSFDISIIASSS